jgi:CRISPR-associated protein Cas1
MVNAVGLGSSVGSLHEPSVCQTKQSLVYDLQEPFRWIADVTVMESFESGVLDLPDFYFTGDDYRYRLEPEAKERFLDLLRERFNSGVRYRDRVLKWDTVIEQKTVELSRYMIGRSSNVDFSEPSPALSRGDDLTLRRRFLGLSPSEARKLGIGKSTFHYLRLNARNPRPFRVFRKTRTKLGLMESS